MRKRKKSGGQEEFRRRIRVGIDGLTYGMGASFLTVSLACHLSEESSCDVTVLELGSPSIYESLGLEKHFFGQEFQSFSQEIQKGSDPRKLNNNYEGINWLVYGSEQLSTVPTLAEEIRLVNNVAGEVILCDFSGRAESRRDEAGKDLIREMDVVIVVLDPLPSRILAGAARLREMEESDLNQLFLINKDNKGVKHREIAHFLNVKNSIRIPYIEPEYLYGAEYSRTLPYHIPEVKKQLEAPLREIADRIFEARPR